MKGSHRNLNTWVSRTRLLSHPNHLVFVSWPPQIFPTQWYVGFRDEIPNGAMYKPSTHRKNCKMHFNPTFTLRFYLSLSCMSGLSCPLLPFLSSCCIVFVFFVSCPVLSFVYCFSKIYVHSSDWAFYNAPTQKNFLDLGHQDSWFCEWERKFLSILVAQLLKNDLHKKLLVMAKDGGEGIVQAPLSFATYQIGCRQV